MMTIEILDQVLDRCAFRDWTFRRDVDGDAFFLQVIFFAQDDVTGRTKPQAGRKWRISKHATGDEVVRTAFLAVLTALEHEAREQFLYLGRPVFGPHLSVTRLWDVAPERVYRPEPPQDHGVAEHFAAAGADPN